MRALLDITERGKVYFVIRLAELAILAQLIEHSIRNRKVVGLNPMDGSIIFSDSRTLFSVSVLFLNFGLPKAASNFERTRSFRAKVMKMTIPKAEMW